MLKTNIFPLLCLQFFVPVVLRFAIPTYVCSNATLSLYYQSHTHTHTHPTEPVVIIAFSLIKYELCIATVVLLRLATDIIIELLNDTLS